MRIAVLGGGGFRVPLIVDALAPLDPDTVVLHDVVPERTEVIAAVLAGSPDAVPTAVEPDLDAALDGADIVLSAIRVGGVEGRVHDERSALDLGVLGQETVGAGGLAYALRSLPVVAGHAAAIARRAPDAWTLTMTNPAGIVTEVMARHLGPRVLGICDSPTGLVRRVCAALGIAVDGPPGTIPDGIDYLGINHLGWLRRVETAGVDRLPDFLADPAAIEATEEGRLFGPDLLAALGAVPNEYLYWYYAHDEALRGVQDAGRTRAEHVRDRQRPFYAAAATEPRRARELWQAANDERNRSYFAELRTDDRDEVDVAAGGYETVAAAAVAALTGRSAPQRMILDVPAGDAVPGLPADLVVELPCVVDRGGATAQPVAGPSTHEAGLMLAVRACEREAARYAETGDANAALRAFALHPLVGSLTAARQLVDGLTNAGRSGP